MRLNFHIVAPAGLLLAALSVSASAADKAWTACQSNKPAASIAGCTIVLKRGDQEAPADRAIAFYNRGNSYFNTGNLAKAIADYMASIEVNPNYPNAYYNRGNAYSNQGDLDNAIADYSDVVRLDPSYAFAYFNRGNAYFKQNKFDLAIADYSQTIALDQSYAPAYLNRGNSYSETREYDRAIADYDVVLQLEPNNDGATGGRSRAMAAASAKPPAESIKTEVAKTEAPKTEAGPKAEVVAKAPEPPAKAAEPVDDAKAAVLPADEKRIALVIGNSAYAAVPPLKNPKNDADLMVKTLESVGFEVTSIFDADQAAMKRAMLDFGRKLRDGADVGLFYYSGHGVQAKGRNYLVPVTAAIRDEDEVAIEAVDVNDFLATMENAASRVNIVILDACRNNPFEGEFRSASRGLSIVTAPRGTYIAYSTAPGSLAEDGDGENSTYTGALSQAILKEGITLEQTFKEVRRLVGEATGKRQVTWDASSITGEFFFRPKAN